MSDLIPTDPAGSDPDVVTYPRAGPYRYPKRSDEEWRRIQAELDANQPLVDEAKKALEGL